MRKKKTVFVVAFLVIQLTIFEFLDSGSKGEILLAFLKFMFI